MAPLHAPGSYETAQEAWNTHYEVDSSIDSRFPSILGFLAGVYMVSVVTLSTASESTAWIPQLVGGVLGVCWIVIGILFKSQQIVWSKPIGLYLLFVAWALTGVVVTPSHEYYWNVYMTTIKVALVTFVTLQCVRSRQDFLFCCMLLGFSSLLVMYQGADKIARSLEFEGKDVKVGARTDGLLIANANDIAEFSIVISIGAVACILGYRSVLLRALSIPTIISGFYMVAASGSRLGMVGVLIAATAMYWFHFRRVGQGAFGKKILLIIIAVGMLGGAVYYVVNSPFFFRLANVASSTSAAKDEPRFQFFIAAVEATARSPIVGLGLGGFVLHRLGSDKSGAACISHSTISETMSCTGIPGFLLYFGSRLSLVLLILRTRKLPLSKKDMGIVDMLMVLFCVLCLFDVVSMTYQQRLEWPFLGMACGYLWNLNRLHREQMGYAYA